MGLDMRLCTGVRWGLLWVLSADISKSTHFSPTPSLRPTRKFNTIPGDPIQLRIPATLFNYNTRFYNNRLSRTQRYLNEILSDTKPQMPQVAGERAIPGTLATTGESNQRSRTDRKVRLPRYLGCRRFKPRACKRVRVISRACRPLDRTYRCIRPDRSSDQNRSDDMVNHMEIHMGKFMINTDQD